MAWAEELIEAARSVNHPRLPFLYVMASQCYMAGRIDAAVRFCEDGQAVINGNRDRVPYGIEGTLCSVYAYIGQPERWVEFCRAQLTRGRDTHAFTKASLVFALLLAGHVEEAGTAANGLIDAAEATQNPSALSFALHAYGVAFCDADPDRARHAQRRVLAIAHESGIRAYETHSAVVLCRLESNYGDPLASFEYVTLAIRDYHDAGDTANILMPMAVLAALLDRLGRYEAAATISGFAFSPLSALAVPEINTAITHLRDVLGDKTYESLARKGEAMTTAAMVAYAYDEIDQARAELNEVSK